MPNWCSNTLTVKGPVREVARFKKTVRSKGVVHGLPPGEINALPFRLLSLHATVPQPEFKDDVRGDKWHGWRTSRWGTKWDVEADLTEVSNKELKYRFDSAWSPPVDWLAATAPLFPKLSFRLWYAEGGCDFGGVFTAEGDECAHSEMSYSEAEISEHGSVNVGCAHCDDDLEVTSVEEERICEECALHRCANCLKLDADHLDGKCLFDATVFKFFHCGPARPA